MFPKDTISKAHYQREKRMLSKLNHPNIIQYAPILGHTRCTKFDVIITTFAPYGSFMDLCQNGVFFGKEKLVRTYFRQLIDGIEYIHSKGIAHLDLKLDNMVIGEDFLLKIVDFDLSQEFGERHVISGGTRDFRAPEIIDRNCSNIFAADIYSIGIILFYLLAGEAPFFEAKVNGVSKILYYDSFEKNNWAFWEFRAEKLGKIGIFSEDFRNLVTGMLRRNPKERWTLYDIKMSKWYWGPVYDRLTLKKEMQKIFETSKKSKKDKLNETMYW